MAERNSFEEVFETELMNAVTIGTEGLMEKLTGALGMIKSDLLQRGRQAYTEKTGTELGQFLEDVRHLDYLSEIIGKLGGIIGVQSTVEPRTADVPFDLHVPQLLQQYGYVTARIISKITGKDSRSVGYLLSRRRKELGIVKDEEHSTSRETRFIRAPVQPESSTGSEETEVAVAESSELQGSAERMIEFLREYGEIGASITGMVTGLGYESSAGPYHTLNKLLESKRIERVGEKMSKGVRYRLTEHESVGYKPDASFENIWKRFTEVAGQHEQGVTYLEVLQAIIDAEQGEGKVPYGADFADVKRRYSGTVRLALGVFVKGQKPIEKANGKWRLKKYSEQLAQEEVRYIEDNTLNVSIAREESVGRWTAEDVWPEHPEKVEQLYEMRLNGHTWREEVGIGMIYLAPKGGSARPVYFWRGGRGDLSAVQQKVYSIIAGHVASTPEEERGFRESIRNVLGRG